MKQLSFFLITIFVLASCTNDDNGHDELTSEQASAAINAAADHLSEDIITLVQSDGLASISTLLDFMFESSAFGNFGFRTDETKARLLEIGKLFGSSVAARVGTNEFPTGVYEWNELEVDFIFVEESENLVLMFPVGDSETNNGIFTLSELVFDINGLPTDIAAMITVDGNLMVDIDFRVNWSDDGFPETADIYIFVSPFTFDFNFNDTAEKTSSLFAVISIGDEVIAAIDLEANYLTTLKLFPSDIEGSIEYRSVKVAGLVDFLAADQSETGDPNDFVHLSLYVEDQKVGDIIFILEANDLEEDYVAYVEYLDGTTESLEDILDNLLEEIEIALDGI